MYTIPCRIQEYNLNSYSSAHTPMRYYSARRIALKIFVPGRICLFGEHSDWAGGYRRTNADVEKGFAIIAGTNQGIYAEVEPHPNALVLSSTTPDGITHGPYEIPMEPKA